MGGLLASLFKTEHRRVREDLSAYLDGELGKRDRARVERHLQRCAACRQELKELRRTVELLHLVPEVPLPRSFLVPVSLARPLPARSLAFTLLRSASAGVTVLLVLALSGNVLLRMGVGPSPLAISKPAASPAAVRAMPTEGAVEAPLLAAAPTSAEFAAAEKAAPPEDVSKKAAVAERPVPVERMVKETVVVEKEAERAATPTPQAMPPLEKEALRLPMAPAIRAVEAPVSSPVPTETPTPASKENLRVAYEAQQPTPEPGPKIEAQGEGAGPTPEPTAAAEAQVSEPQLVAAPPTQVNWRQVAQTTLNSVMWALLVATVALWAVTAIVSRQRR